MVSGIRVSISFMIEVIDLSVYMKQLMRVISRNFSILNSYSEIVWFFLVGIGSVGSEGVGVGVIGVGGVYGVGCVSEEVQFVVGVGVVGNVGDGVVVYVGGEV